MVLTLNVPSTNLAFVANVKILVHYVEHVAPMPSVKSSTIVLDVPVLNVTLAALLSVANSIHVANPILIQHLSLGFSVKAMMTVALIPTVKRTLACANLLVEPPLFVLPMRNAWLAATKLRANAKTSWSLIQLVN